MMKTDKATGHDPAKQYEGTTSPKNPSIQLTAYTVLGVCVILVACLYWFLQVVPAS